MISNLESLTSRSTWSSVTQLKTDHVIRTKAPEQLLNGPWGEIVLLSETLTIREQSTTGIKLKEWQQNYNLNSDKVN